MRQMSNALKNTRGDSDKDDCFQGAQAMSVNRDEAKRHMQTRGFVFKAHRSLFTSVEIFNTAPIPPVFQHREHDWSFSSIDITFVIRLSLTRSTLLFEISFTRWRVAGRHMDYNTTDLVFAFRCSFVEDAGQDMGASCRCLVHGGKERWSLNVANSFRQ
jgi:hypothetical protein